MGERLPIARANQADEAAMRSTLGSTRRVAGTTSEDLRSEGYTDRGRGTYSSRPRRGYFAAFFLRSAQEAVIRSDTASFSLAVI